MASREPSRLRAVVVVLGLVSVIVALHLAGGLRSPAPMFDEPVFALATISRWVALVLSYYLLGLTCLVVVFGERIEQSRWGRVGPAALIGMVSVMLGTSSVAGPMLITNHDSAGESTSSEPDSALVLTELDAPLTLDEVPQRAHSEPLTSAGNPSLVGSARVDSWVVEPGDSLWSIAEEHLEDELGSSDVTEEVIADYWLTLIDANTDRLTDPNNPDFILPGQEFVLPDVHR